MRSVYLAYDLADAHLVQGLLEQKGIGSTVKNEALGMALGDLPWAATRPEVLVDEHDWPAARELIREAGLISKDPERDPDRCPACGADISDTNEARCPKCGADLPSSKGWRCPKCGELIEPQFAECWRCAAG